MNHLGVDEGDKLLDVPCADGRLTIPLQQHGFKLTGVDLSTRCIKAAQSDAQGMDVNWVQADMRTMKFPDKFDGAFCMGNSFGYFDENDSRKFLLSVCDALRPTAGFILDTCLAAETLFTVGGTKEWVELNGTLMLMESEYHCATAELHSQFTFIKDGSTERHKTVHYIFTTAQICRMLEDAGFKVHALYGDTEDTPFGLGSERLLLHAIKP